MRCDGDALLDDTGRIDWTAGAGVYHLAHGGGCLQATVRATGQSFEVPPELLVGSASCSEWRIEANWGEQQAKLTNGAISVSLHEIALQSLAATAYLPIKDTASCPDRQPASSSSGSGRRQALRVQLSKQKAAPGTLAAAARAAADALVRDGSPARQP